MLKQLRLLSAVLACVLISTLPKHAMAVHINPDNTGQVLIYPYYSTRNDNATLISVVNTTGAGKAVKVQFLEGVNGRIVLDFNLYLSAFDTWTGAVVDSTDTEGAALLTNDASCTVPYFFLQGVSTGLFSRVDFSNTRYVGDSTDGVLDGLDRTREGYIIMTEMGEVVDDNGVQPGEGSLTAISIPAFDAISVDDPLFDGCLAIENAFDDSSDNPYFVTGAVADAIQTDMTPPKGGLTGSGTTINVPGARATGYTATSLAGFYAPSADIAQSLHSTPDSGFPNLSSGFPNTSQVLLAGEDTASLVTDEWARFDDALNSILIADQVMNQYAAEQIIAGGTQWVITHPNKTATVSSDDIAPYTEPFSGTNAGQLCEGIIINEVDRNGEVFDQILPLIIIDPPPPSLPPLQACNEVNVLSVTTGGSVFLESTLGIAETDLDVIADFGSTFEAGWLQLSFNSDTAIEARDSRLGGGGPSFDITHELINSSSQNVYRGLPVIGFATTTADAGSFQFGYTFEHIYRRVITD